MLSCLLYTSDEEMLELVEMEIRELLSFYDFDGDNTPIIRGSALGALNGVPQWEEKVMELMDAVDTWIPLPPRDIDKPFLMPVEDVFSITGRGTVATGRIEAGVIHVGDEVEILGLGEDKKSVFTGVEMFRKLLDQGEAGDNVGLLLRGIDKNEIKRGMILHSYGQKNRSFASSLFQKESQKDLISCILLSRLSILLRPDCPSHLRRTRPAVSGAFLR